MNNDQNSDAEVCTCGVHDRTPIAMPIPGPGRPAPARIPGPGVLPSASVASADRSWLREAGPALVITVLLAMMGGIGMVASAMERRAARIEELDRKLYEERGRSLSLQSGEASRQCMITVARGDYDDLIARLGWTRPAGQGKRLVGDGTIEHPYHMDGGQ